MNKNPQVFLKHILESIEWIGEAVKNLPGDFKKQYPDIPWQKISGLRDKLIHGYFGIDLELVWKIVKKDLPLFKIQIREMLNSLEIVSKS